MVPPMKPELSGKCDSHYFEVNQVNSFIAMFFL